MRLDLATVPLCNRDKMLRLDRCERRAWIRRPEQGTAMAAFYDADGAICLTRVELRDASATGLGIRSPLRIDAGSRVCLYTNDVISAHGPHLSATVVRCEEAVNGDEEADEPVYTLGLRRDRPWLPAAA